jgi:hypothetical protein
VRRRHRNETEEIPLPAPVGSIGSTTEETDFRKEYQLGILFMLILLVSFHCKHVLMCLHCMALVAAAVNENMALEGAGGGGGSGGGVGEAKDQPLRSKAQKGSSTQQDPHQQRSPRTNAAKVTPARFK